MRIKAKLWGFGRSPMVFGVWEGVGGGRLVLKTASSPGTATPSITGALFRSERFYWSLRVAKMEHSNLGLRRDGASINEGKDPERVGHLEQSADQGLGRVGRHAVAGLHGRSAGTRGGRDAHWQFAVQWQNPRSFAAIKKDLPSLTLRRSGAGPPQ